MLSSIADEAAAYLLWILIWIICYPIAWILCAPYILIRAFFPAPDANGYWDKVVNGYIRLNNAIARLFENLPAV